MGWPVRPQRQELFVTLHCVSCIWYNAWELKQIFTDIREEDREVGGCPWAPLCMGWKAAAGVQNTGEPASPMEQLASIPPSSERPYPELLGVHTSRPSPPAPHTAGCPRGQVRSLWVLPELGFSWWGRKGNKEGRQWAGGVVGTGYWSVVKRNLRLILYESYGRPK